ncbi:MAG: rod-binding protein [Phycisphaerales bacterium]|nr:rod-binding protein [Phycisphaerales bacterium]
MNAISDKLNIAAPSAPQTALRPGDTRSLQFLRELGRAKDANNPQDPRLAREASSELLSNLFFQPLLAEARKMPFQSELFSGGRGEEVFGEQLDIRVADAVAAANPGGIAQSVERYFEPRISRGRVT